MNIHVHPKDGLENYPLGENNCDGSSFKWNNESYKREKRLIYDGPKH